jgi:hypothetical protein
MTVVRALFRPSERNKKTWAVGARVSESRTISENQHAFYFERILRNRRNLLCCGCTRFMCRFYRSARSGVRAKRRTMLTLASFCVLQDEIEDDDEDLVCSLDSPTSTVVPPIPAPRSNVNPWRRTGQPFFARVFGWF